jgi:hypothetical protein
MKTLFTLILLSTSMMTHAQVMDQLTVPREPQVDALESMEIHYGGTTRKVPMGDGGTLVSTKIDNRFGLVEFSFVARGKMGGERSWIFGMPERARQTMNVHITDDTKSADGLSARLLETSLYFFPRKVHSTIEGVEGVLRVTLPTGEAVDFDPNSQAIVGGVLKETGALDLNPDRVKRKFAQVAYEGAGVMIRVDRRAGSPEGVYKSSYNVNEDIKNATVSFKGQICKVPKELLFDQNAERGFYFLYPTDQEFYEKVLKVKCGWTDLPME